jgi:hypothetical protein
MSFFVLATIVSSSISHGPSQFRTAVMSIMSGLDAEIGAAAASDSRAPEILPETNIGFKVILFPSRLLQLTSFLFLSLCNLLITFFCDAVVQSKCHELRIWHLTRKLYSMQFLLWVGRVGGGGWRPNSFLLNWGSVLYSASEEVRLEGGHGSWCIWAGLNSDIILPHIPLCCVGHVSHIPLSLFRILIFFPGAIVTFFMDLKLCDLPTIRIKLCNELNCNLKDLCMSTGWNTTQLPLNHKS